MSSFKFVLGFSFFFFLSCSTQQRDIASKKFKNRVARLKTSKLRGGGVLFSVRLLQDKKCLLSFVNSGTSKTLKVSLKSNSSESFRLLDLEPGNYKVGELKCGLTRVFKHKNFFGSGKEEFEVIEGKVLYLGSSTLSFDTKNDAVLKWTRKNHHSGLRSVYKRLSNFVRKNLYSPYSYKEIEKSALKSFQEFPEISIEAEIEEKERDDLRKDLGFIREILMNCHNEEMERNPLSFGIRAYELHFEKAKLQSSLMIPGKDVFTEKLDSCLQKSWEGLSMNVMSAYKVKLSL